MGFSAYQNYDEAEKFYKRAIEANPKHAYSLYNYAVLLEEVRKDYDAAQKYFKRAIAASPKDPLALGDYGNVACHLSS